MTMSRHMCRESHRHDCLRESVGKNIVKVRHYLKAGFMTGR